MQNRQQKFGEKGEALAVRRLKKAGYKIIETNYRTRHRYPIPAIV